MKSCGLHCPQYHRFMLKLALKSYGIDLEVVKK